MAGIPQPKTVPRPWYGNFLLGGSAACSGWMFVHPFDLLKVRKQLLGEAGGANIGMVKMARNIVANEGVTGLYGGLSAAVARQLSYGNMRLGIYAELKHLTFGKKDPSITQKFGLGMTAGGIASFISNPIEVSLVRMQADGRLPKAQQRGYSSVFSALYRIGAEEGASAYMTGAAPTVARAMLVNMLQLGGYDVFKTFYSDMGVSGVPLHLTSAVSAGFVYSAATLPLDTAKTRMQNQVVSAEGKLPYRSLPHCLGKIARTEGLASLWNGFLPYFVSSITDAFTSQLLIPSSPPSSLLGSPPNLI